ncbi:MAG TPA: hypothetical protein VGH43_14835, partial [Jatrophihabitans sp.]
YAYQLELDGPDGIHDLTGVGTFEVLPEGKVPNVDRVLAYLGEDQADPDLLTLAAARLPVVLAFVKSYTRGQGFTADGIPDDALSAVIIAAAARELNTEQGLQRQEIGTTSYYYGPNPQDFTLRELLIMNGYRRRVA